MNEFKLEEIRKSKGFSRRELAERSGVHEQTIKSLELNYNDPYEAKLNTLIKLASVLKCKVREFYPCEENI